MRKVLKKVLITVAVTALWCLVWHFAVAAANKKLLVKLPTPFDTVGKLSELFSQKLFWNSLLNSLWHVALGFAAAILAGVVLALISAKSGLFKTFSAPVLGIVRAVPVAALIIVVFLWVKKENIPALISFITVLPIIWANTESGILSADKGLYEMAGVMGLGKGECFKNITLPAVMPHFTAAVSSSLGFAFKSGIAAEVICRSQNSLGELLWRFKNDIEYDGVFAVCVVIVLLSLAIELAVKRLIGGKRR